MSWFGANREHQERDIRELVKLGRPISVEKISHNLISKHEHMSNPHNRVGREFMKKTDDIIQEIIRKNQESSPIRSHFKNHRLFINDEQSMATLRALRSSGKKTIYLELTN